MEKDSELKGLSERCEEVEAVMGQTPPWLFQWGITMIAVIAGCIIASTWFVRWPDTLTVHGYIEITQSSESWEDMAVNLSARQVSCLRMGMEAEVALNAKDKSWGFYRGKVMEIPLMTDSTGLYIVHIHLNKYERTSEGHASLDNLKQYTNHSMHPILETTAKITISDKRLLSKILGR